MTEPKMHARKHQTLLTADHADLICGEGGWDKFSTLGTIKLHSFNNIRGLVALLATAVHPTWIPIPRPG